MKRFKVMLVLAMLVLAAVPAFALAQVSAATINSTGSLSQRGFLVTVSGTATCASSEWGNWAEVFVEVKQPIGTNVARGGEWTEITCDGTVQNWTMTVHATSSSPLFKKGQASVLASVCDWDNCVQVERRIQLK